MKDPAQKKKVEVDRGRHPPLGSTHMHTVFMEKGMVQSLQIILTYKMISVF